MSAILDPITRLREAAAELQARHPDLPIREKADELADRWRSGSIRNPAGALVATVKAGMPTRAQLAEARKAPAGPASPRGTFRADGSWDRNGSTPSPAERELRRLDAAFAAAQASPADAVSMLAESTARDAFREPCMRLWATLTTTESWRAAPCSTSAESWLKTLAVRRLG